MYKWRELNDQERWKLLQKRRKEHVPHHAPPKDKMIQGLYILNAACFEHHPHMQELNRRVELADTLSELMDSINARIHAWTVLPNHYHFLIDLYDPVDLRPKVGKIHGKLSRLWNVADNKTGRAIWYSSFDRPIRSRRHFYTSMNYIHHNAVKHGYCKKWKDWETSSAASFLDEVGYEKALQIWQAFPIKSYGKSIEG